MPAVEGTKTRAQKACRLRQRIRLGGVGTRRIQGIPHRKRCCEHHRDERGDRRKDPGVADGVRGGVACEVARRVDARPTRKTTRTSPLQRRNNGPVSAPARRARRSVAPTRDGGIVGKVVGGSSTVSHASPTADDDRLLSAGYERLTTFYRPGEVCGVTVRGLIQRE